MLIYYLNVRKNGWIKTLACHLQTKLPPVRSRTSDWDPFLLEFCYQVLFRPTAEAGADPEGVTGVTSHPPKFH